MADDLTTLLQRDVNSGSFVPFIGAAVPADRSGAMEGIAAPSAGVPLAWMTCSERIQRLATRFDPESAEAIYLGALLDGRAPSIIFRRDTTSNDAVGPSPHEMKMDRFRYALTCLNTTLSQGIGLSLFERPRPLEPDSRIALALRQPESSKGKSGQLFVQLHDQLIELLAAAEAITKDDGGRRNSNEEPEWIPPKFAARAVSDKLQRMALYLLGDRGYLSLPWGEGEGRIGVLADRPRNLVHSIEANLDHMCSRHEVLEFRDRKDSVISPDMTEWLSDLLWYTFMFDVAAYPTTDELGFLFSLTSDGSRVIRPPQAEFSQAAGLVIHDPEDQHRLAKWVGTMFRFFESSATARPPNGGAVPGRGSESGTHGNGQPGHVEGRLLEYIVRALQKSHAEYSNQVSRIRHPTGRPPNVMPAMAFTTNFDQSLEHALANRGMNYHVVYPLRSELHGASPPRRDGAQDRPGNAHRPAEESPDPPSDVYDEGRQPKWILRTVGPDGALPKAWEERELPSYIILDRSCSSPPLRFLGPLVVKLHGSPLDDEFCAGDAQRGQVLCEQKVDADLSIKHDELSRDNEIMDFRHFLVLPEINYLRSLFSYRESIPQWLWEGLTNPRPSRQEPFAIWFLGYSVRDWNIRLQLYSQGLYGHPREWVKLRKYLVSSYVDPFSESILQALHITPLPHDFKDLESVFGRVVG